MDVKLLRATLCEYAPVNVIAEFVASDLDPEKCEDCKRSDICCCSFLTGEEFKCTKDNRNE